MKLKTRLKISFFLISIMPIVLIGTMFRGLIKYQSKVIDKRYEISGTDFSDMLNPVEIVINVVDRIGDKISDEIEDDIGKLETKEYQDELSSYLLEKSADMVINKNGEFIFVTEGTLHYSLEDLSPDRAQKIIFSDEGLFLEYDGDCVVKQIRFRDKNDNRYIVSIMAYIKDIAPSLREFWLESIFGVTLMLIIMGSVLVVWIYQNTIIPLGRLREAAQNITNGNLDFEIDVRGNNEIDDLFRDFEIMRVKLRDTSSESAASERKSKELIRNISHDLKTPLTAIKGYVEGLRDGIADTPEKRDKYLKTIYKKATDMDRLIDELTLYSKIDTNKIPYSFNKIVANDFFEDCRDSLSVELEAKGIDFTYENMLQDNVEIIADGEQLGRVVDNIISNSIKYQSIDKLHINLSIKDEGDFIRVAFSDNGKGISKKDLPYIFDRMYRTDESRNSATGGSGIGLAIVKKIIEDHGGQIWAESIEDEGTTIVFVLRKYVGGNNE